jgi:hypothetical protein
LNHRWAEAFETGTPIAVDDPSSEVTITRAGTSPRWLWYRVGGWLGIILIFGVLWSLGRFTWPERLCLLGIGGVILFGWPTGMFWIVLVPLGFGVRAYKVTREIGRLLFWPGISN